MSKKYREWKEGVKENNRLQSIYLAIYEDHIEVCDPPPRLSRKQQTSRAFKKELKDYKREFKNLRKSYQNEASRNHKTFKRYWKMKRPLVSTLHKSNRRKK